MSAINKAIGGWSGVILAADLDLTEHGDQGPPNSMENEDWQGIGPICGYLPPNPSETVNSDVDHLAEV